VWLGRGRRDGYTMTALVERGGGVGDGGARMEAHVAAGTRPRRTLSGRVIDVGAGGDRGRPGWWILLRFVGDGDEVGSSSRAPPDNRSRRRCRQPTAWMKRCAAP